MRSTPFQCSHRALGLAAAAAALALPGVSRGQSLTTTFAADNGHYGMMFDVVASAAVTLDTFDVHFEDKKNPAPGCTTTSSCSVNEVEVYYRPGGWSGYENDPSAWVLLGSVQHTITTPLGSGQPLNLPLGLGMEPPGGAFPSVLGFYITATGAVNSVTGTLNEFMAYTDGGTVYSNGQLAIQNGGGMDYPFLDDPYVPREWNGTVYYSAGVSCGQNASSYCTSGVSAAGCVAAISATGISSATAPSGFVVSTAGNEGQKPGLFFWGKAAKNPAITIGGGSSFACVEPPVKRGSLLNSGGTNGACDGGFSFDLNARWASQPAQASPAGTTLYGQFWYRDPTNTSGQSTGRSDALRWTVCP